jgi:hypothetical protein
MPASLYTAILYPHIALGFVGLGSFWGAACFRKGSTRHIQCGVIFYWSMIFVAITAFLMAITVILDPTTIHSNQPARASQEFALFLTYLGILSMTCVVNGRAYDRHQSDLRRIGSPQFITLNGLTALSAVLILLYGIATGNILFIALSIPGLHVGQKNLRYMRTVKTTQPSPRDWFFAHFGEMIGGGIAVHTAFLAGGGSRFLPEVLHNLGWWLWLVPSVVGLIAIRILNRRFGEI